MLDHVYELFMVVQQPQRTTGRLTGGQYQVKRFFKLISFLPISRLNFRNIFTNSVTMEELKDVQSDIQVGLSIEIKRKNENLQQRRVKSWTEEEDSSLLILYEQHPTKWGIIANSMPNRTENQCLHRYRRIAQMKGHKKIWTSQEDQALLKHIEKLGKNWKLISEIMGTKTGKQVRQRFINSLDPKIKTDDWTEEQDKLIVKHFSELGSRWAQISKKLPGRPENKIKNRFYSYIVKNYEIKGKFTTGIEQPQSVSIYIQKPKKGSLKGRITMKKKEPNQDHQDHESQQRPHASLISHQIQDPVLSSQLEGLLNLQDFEEYSELP